jgi:hypothetical protein
MATWAKLAYESDVILKAVLTAHGQILYASGANTPAALDHGNDGDVLTLASSLPSWAAPGAPAVHAASHHTGEADELHLSDLVAGAAVNFAGYQATDMVLENLATPGTAVLGKVYFDTTGGDLSAYVCTAI